MRHSQDLYSKVPPQSFTFCICGSMATCRTGIRNFQFTAACEVSAICGMIIFALYTVIVSPIPSCNSFRCSHCVRWRGSQWFPPARPVQKTATGLISPVLDGLHSISRRWVSLISSAHLNAKAFLGNFAVLPRESPYAISS